MPKERVGTSRSTVRRRRKRPKRQLSLERTLAAVMSVQPPIGERRLSEILKPLDSERRATSADPDRDFDHFFEKAFGWDAVGKDRYKLYKEWLECDGDLVYLAWLEIILMTGDDLVKSIREDLRGGARVAKSTKELRDFIDSPFMDYVGGWIVTRTAQSIKDSVPSNQWLKMTADSIIREACRQAFVYFLYNSKPEKQKRAQKGLRDLLLNDVPGFLPSSPLGELLWEYAVEPELNRSKKGGNRPDNWGTFLLMALTDHLREDNERRKRPRYKLCHNLVDLFRGNSPIPKRTDSLAQTKIQNLKVLHPNWPQHLLFLRQIFERYLTGKTQSTRSHVN